MPVAAAVVGNGGIGAVLAARDVPAEGRRAAALDRRHHLQLAEADMAGVGLTPRRAVAAEDIRSRTGRVMTAGRYAGGSDLRAVSGVRRSSGLMTARITLVATCA